jgi:1-aminocyclopropane-1-carboxylate deaminase/D-cysteine desulfhydrase-like pyridoxal-dependent ACC family enzyme
LIVPPALFTAMPRAAEALAWLPLGRFPTRVERVTGLLPPSVELWVKREDELAPYGGNKVRKLEFMLGEARARGCTCLCTFGGTGAHHVAATAVYGARLGFDVTAVLFPQPLDDHVRELLALDEAMGARLVFVRSLAGIVPAWLRAHASAATAWLAGGGSSMLGTLGWVSGALEVAAQVRGGELPAPDAVYAALGSGGTIAGLWWGLRARRPIDLVGVRVVGGPSAEVAARWLVRAVDHRLARLGAAPPGARPRLRVERGFLGRGYGHATPESLHAVAVAARAGLTLDPIYTGKVMAALLAHARTGRLDGKRVLFLHTFNTRDLGPLVAGRA